MLYGHVSNQHGRIGIYWSPISHRIAKVHLNSPAEHAGLLKGDVITAIDGKPPHMGDIEGDAGTTVTLTIQRQSQVFQVVIERIPIEFIHKD